MKSSHWRAQVELLLQVLPHVAKEPVFALKGGSAINLFVRPMPRLSVDIDLTYLPIEDRSTAMSGIAEALGRISKRVEQIGVGYKTQRLYQPSGKESKIVCTSSSARIKLEVNTVIRGNIFPVRTMDLAEKVETEFGKFVSMTLVSHAELFGGKICAALDRQHPRDVFDIQQLFLHEGLGDDLILGFIVMLLSHARPIHELLKPNITDQREAFNRQFSGMTLIPFSYDDFEVTRDRLIQEIRARLTEKQKTFLLSFKSGSPEWDLISLELLHRLPAVQWKLANIEKLKHQNSLKHVQQFRALEKVLFGL